MTPTEKAEAIGALYGPAMQALADCIRSFVTAPEGRDLIAVDFSAIEARGIQWLAGNDKVLDGFRAGDSDPSIPDAYMSAAHEMFGEPVTSKKDPKRQIGKVAVLSCLGPDTLVFTDRGIKALTSVTKADKVWDGLDWTDHAGVVARGRKLVLRLPGLDVTVDHEVKTGDTWNKMLTVVSSGSYLYQALETGLESLRLLELSSNRPGAYTPSWSNALAGRSPTKRTVRTCIAENLRAAISARRKKRDTGEKLFTNTPVSYRTTSTDAACCVDYRPSGTVAVIRNPPNSLTTAAEASSCSSRGLLTKPHFSATSYRFRGGMIHNLILTAPTTKKDTNPEICGSSHTSSTLKTGVRYRVSRNALSFWSEVFDIAHAGSRNAFLILADFGPLLVHNCGYQGGVAAMQKMAANNRVDMATAYGPLMEVATDGQIDAAEKACRQKLRQFPKMSREFFIASDIAKQRWRASNPLVVQYWRDLQDTAIAAVAQPGSIHSAGAPGRQVRFRKSGSFLWLRLPSGRTLCYPYPLLQRRPVPWGKEIQVAGLTEDQAVEKYKDRLLDYENGIATVLEPEFRDALTYMCDDKAKGGWGRTHTYSGALAENCTQAVCRDILTDAMLRVEAAGYEIVSTVYDEIVTEQDEGWGSLAEVERLMCITEPWAAGFPVAAEGWRSRRYRKA